MTSTNSIESSISNTWTRRLVGIGVTLGVVAFGAGAVVASSLGTDNASAQRVEAATKVMRTNQWLEARSLDTSSSVDMMRALIMACDEIKARGEAC